MKKLNLKLFLTCTIVGLVQILNAQGDAGTDPNEGTPPYAAPPDAPAYWHVQSDPCNRTATSWYLGGNMMWNYGPYSDIGTCNDYPFILKANNFKSVFITSSGKIGINATSPLAALEVSEPNQYAAQISNFRIYGDVNGNLESNTDINMNFATGKTFNINEGPANSGAKVLNIVGGKVGINTPNNPLSNLEVRNVSNTDIYSYSTNSNGTAGLWALNGSTNYGLRIDAAGLGHISQNVAGVLNLLNFQYNTTFNMPQVWVGTRPTTGSHTNFSFAAEKIVAKEMYVFVSGSWADYVFATDYKLRNLLEVEAYYKVNKHLPDVPAEKEVVENGINTAKMDAILLQKIEELTLYMVELHKKVERLETENRELKSK